MHFIQSPADFICINCEVENENTQSTNDSNESFIRIIPKITSADVCDEKSAFKPPMHEILQMLMENSNSTKTIQSVVKSHNNSKIVTKPISVTKNSFYQLTVDLSYNLFTNNEELSPTGIVTFRSVDATRGWKYTINSSVTAKFPIVCAEIYIPDVQLIQIEIETVFKVDIAIPYQMDIHINHCTLQIDQKLGEYQKSWRVKRPQSNAVCNPNASQAHMMHMTQTNSIYSLVEHVYMLKPSFSNLDQSVAFSNWCENNGIMYQPIQTLEEQTIFDNQNDNVTCTHCFQQDQQQKTQNLQSKSIIQKEVCALCITQLLIRTLQDAIISNRQSILILQDELVPHKNFHSVLADRIEDVPRQWAFLYFGANSLKQISTISKDNVAPWLKIGDQHLQSEFALAVQGQQSMQTLLQYLQEMLQKHIDPLLGLQLFLSRFGNAWLCNPNLFIPSEGNVRLKFLLQEYSSEQIENLNPGSFFYWNRKQNYIDLCTSNQNTWWSHSINKRLMKTVHFICIVTANSNINTKETLETILKTWEKIEFMLTTLKNQTYKHWKLHFLLPAQFNLNQSAPISNDFIDVHYVNSGQTVQSLNAIISVLPSNDFISLISLDEIATEHRTAQEIRCFYTDLRFQSGYSKAVVPTSAQNMDSKSIRQSSMIVINHLHSKSMELQSICGTSAKPHDMHIFTSVKTLQWILQDSKDISELQNIAKQKCRYYTIPQILSSS